MLCAHDVLLAEDTPVKVLDKIPVIVNRWQTRNWNQAREKKHVMDATDSRRPSPGYRGERARVGEGA
ncbi:TPA: hypothetical protein MH604_00940 [Klebsiella pneumoniae]|nr:hypothetical protein [Klebsiella pneumoniae]